MLTKFIFPKLFYGLGTAEWVEWVDFEIITLYTKMGEGGIYFYLYFYFIIIIFFFYIN